jgi:hypothetical protein
MVSSASLEIGQVWEVRSSLNERFMPCLVLFVTKRTWVRLLNLERGDELTFTTARWDDPVTELVGRRLL